MIGLGAHPFGECLNRGDHRLPLQAGQDPGQNHRIAGQGEGQRPGRIGSCLVGFRVGGWVQHSHHPGHECRHRVRGQIPPQRGQLPDHGDQFLELEAVGVTGDGLHMLGGDDSGGPGSGHRWSARRPAPRHGPACGHAGWPTAARPGPPRRRRGAGCRRWWPRASGGPTHTPQRRTRRPAPPHPRPGGHRRASPSPAGPPRSPAWHAATGPPHPWMPTAPQPHHAWVHHRALLVNRPAHQTSPVRTSVRTIRPG